MLVLSYKHIKVIKIPVFQFGDNGLKIGDRGPIIGDYGLIIGDRGPRISFRGFKVNLEQGCFWYAYAFSRIQ